MINGLYCHPIVICGWQTIWQVRRRWLPDDPGGLVILDGGAFHPAAAATPD
jgi:hypothetical protein